jgi:hypothetical protein
MRPRFALAVFVALAVLQTWPLSVAPWRRSLNYNADAQQCAWTLCWVPGVGIREALDDVPRGVAQGDGFARVGEARGRVRARDIEPHAVAGFKGSGIRCEDNKGVRR